MAAVTVLRSILLFVNLLPLCVCHLTQCETMLQIPVSGRGSRCTDASATRNRESRLLSGTTVTFAETVYPQSSIGQSGHKMMSRL